MEAEKPEVPFLSDDEVVRLYDKTNWSNFYESQRTNILVLAYNLGQRAETYLELTVGCFHPQKTETGLELLVKYPKQKAMQANQQNAHKPLRDQLILPRDNPKICGIEAWRRQMAILPDATDPGAWFWRSAGIQTKKPGGRAGPATFEGVVNWAKEVLGRGLTFKDVSRRPVVTALVDQLGAHKAAKAVGMRPRNTDRYHRCGADDVRREAAEALQQVFFSPHACT